VANTCVAMPSALTPCDGKVLIRGRPKCKMLITITYWSKIVGEDSFQSKLPEEPEKNNSRTRERKQRLLTFLAVSAWASSLGMNSVVGASCIQKLPERTIVVLDVGHIAKQPGQQCPLFTTCPWGQTSARGKPEYEFNLLLATHVRDELVRAGFVSTELIITDRGGAAGLLERVERGEKSNADFFLSIHHDGVNDQYLRRWTYQNEEQFYYDESKGFSLHVSTKNGRFRESYNFAKTLADDLIAKGLSINTTHEKNNPVGAQVPFLDKSLGIYQRDNLRVLNSAKMPAVLLEAGVIVNREEELSVSTGEYQNVIAGAVVKAVGRLCRE
jgi:N-acetylmuramoyl-L-alanine amidase